MNVLNFKILVLVTAGFMASGCSSTKVLRSKYISADLRKQKSLLEKNNEKVGRIISSNYIKKGPVLL